jgi:hypothetical protein
MLTRTIKVSFPATGYRLPVAGLALFIDGPLGTIAEHTEK